VFAALDILTLNAPESQFVHGASVMLFPLFYLPNAWLGSLVGSRNASTLARVSITVSAGLVFWLIHSYIVFIVGVWIWLSLGGSF
jgi:hypothetical protein